MNHLTILCNVCRENHVLHLYQLPTKQMAFETEKQPFSWTQVLRNFAKSLIFYKSFKYGYYKSWHELILTKSHLTSLIEKLKNWGYEPTRLFFSENKTWTFSYDKHNVTFIQCEMYSRNGVNLFLNDEKQASISLSIKSLRNIFSFATGYSYTLLSQAEVNDFLFWLTHLEKEVKDEDHESMDQRSEEH